MGPLFSFHLVEIPGQARDDGEMLNQVQHDGGREIAGRARNDGRCRIGSGMTMGCEYLCRMVISYL